MCYFANTICRKNKKALLKRFSIAEASSEMGSFIFVQRIVNIDQAKIWRESEVSCDVNLKL